jgi:hypothetical protein
MRLLRKLFNAAVFCGFFIAFNQEPFEILALSWPIVGLICLDACFLLYRAVRLMLDGFVRAVVAWHQSAPQPIRRDPPARFVRPRFVEGRWSHAVSQE